MLEGVIACMEDGWFVSEIADAAYAFQSKIAAASGSRSASTATWRTTAWRPRPCRSTRASRRRNSSTWPRSSRLATTTPSAARWPVSPRTRQDPTVNLMPALIEAAHNLVTLGESMRALEAVFGVYVERHVA